MTRSLIARLWVENSYATRQDDGQAQESGEPAHHRQPTTSRISSRSSGFVRGDAEGVFHHARRLLPRGLPWCSRGGRARAPASTFSPTLTSRMTPTAGSMESSFLSRPAPIMLEATPMSSASMALT